MEVSKDKSQVVKLDASLVEKIEKEEMVLVKGGINITLRFQLNLFRGCSRKHTKF